MTKVYDVQTQVKSVIFRSLQKNNMNKGFFLATIAIPWNKSIYNGWRNSRENNSLFIWKKIVKFALRKNRM